VATGRYWQRFKQKHPMTPHQFKTCWRRLSDFAEIIKQLQLTGGSPGSIGRPVTSIWIGYLVLHRVTSEHHWPMIGKYLSPQTLGMFEVIGAS
jgi:hypothetical protein